MAFYTKPLASAVKILQHDFQTALRFKDWDRTKLVQPFRILRHPVLAINEIKYENRGSVALANIILALFFLSHNYAVLGTGFVFNYSRLERFDIVFEFARTIMPILFWCIANWSITTLMSGEGKFKEIWITVCYSTMPYVATLVPIAILSRVLCLEEQVFFSMASSITSVWVFLLLFISTIVVHQYTLRKTIISMLLTVLGIAAILFLLILLFSLFQQLITFVNTIITEMSYRI